MAFKGLSKRRNELHQKFQGLLFYILFLTIIVIRKASLSSSIHNMTDCINCIAASKAQGSTGSPLPLRPLRRPRVP